MMNRLLFTELLCHVKSNLDLLACISAKLFDWCYSVGVRRGSAQESRLVEEGRLGLWYGRFRHIFLAVPGWLLRLFLHHEGDEKNDLRR